MELIMWLSGAYDVAQLSVWCGTIEFMMMRIGVYGVVQ